VNDESKPSKSCRVFLNGFKADDVNFNFSGIMSGEEEFEAAHDWSLFFRRMNQKQSL